MKKVMCRRYPTTKKASSFLSTCLIITLLFTIHAGLSESNFLGIPVEELSTRLAYRCSLLDSDLNMKNFLFIDNINGIGRANFDGYILSVSSLDESLPVIDVSVYLLKNGDFANAKSVIRQCALIAALEYEMPDSKTDLESESKLVKKEAMSIHEKILDVLEANLFTLMSGDDVICYSGQHYDYYLHYDDGDILLHASVK